MIAQLFGIARQSKAAIKTTEYYCKESIDAFRGSPAVAPTASNTKSEESVPGVKGTKHVMDKGDCSSKIKTKITTHTDISRMHTWFSRLKHIAAPQTNPTHVAV